MCVKDIRKVESGSSWGPTIEACRVQTRLKSTKFLLAIWIPRDIKKSFSLYFQAELITDSALQRCNIFIIFFLSLFLSVFLSFVLFLERFRLAMKTSISKIGKIAELTYGTTGRWKEMNVLLKDVQNLNFAHLYFIRQHLQYYNNAECHPN